VFHKVKSQIHLRKIDGLLILGSLISDLPLG
jgi:hypothetical protein